ncbi:MAG TPA: ABC transporter ATP-binding protein [Gaiellaceae bacterium]|nr:ABC transporter ATP-binding protein [Gaiellaceae bacterium]
MTLRHHIRRLVAPPPLAETRLVAAAPAVAVRELARRFWPDLRPDRVRLLLLLPLLAAVPAVEATEVWLFKHIVDDALVPGELEPLLWLGLAAAGLALLGGLLGFVDELLSTSIGERFLLRVRGRLYDHLHRESGDGLDRRRLGDVLARLTSDVQAIESFLLGGITEAISAVLRILIFTVALFLISWDLALVSLVVAPLFWLAARRFSRLIRVVSREKRRRSGSLGAVAEEGLSNAALVRAYGREREETERFTRESEGIVSAELAAARLRALFAPLVDLIELGGVLLVLGWGTWAIAEGRLTIGGLLAFVAYLGLLYRPIRDLGDLSTTIFSAAAAAERVLELLDAEPAVRERPDAREPGRVQGLIELDGVTVHYPGRDVPALDRVSLRIEPGETVLLVGASGSGKSTLVKLLLRFIDPDSGRILLDGHDLRELRLRPLRDKLAVLLQETLVLHGTIRGNIAYGRPAAAEGEIVAAARAAGAHGFVSALPDGYETVVGERGRSLSGGQRRRIALARALLRDAPVLVLDEPTAGLDTKSTAELADALPALSAGRTTIVVSHDLSLARAVDTVVVLEGGRVVEHGRPETLRLDEGPYAGLLAAVGGAA